MPIRSGALLHVHYDPVRCVVIGYEFALNYCPDHDKGDPDLATIGPNRHINSQADSIHLLPELLQCENYNPRSSIMAGFEVGGWLDWLRPIVLDSIAKIFLSGTHSWHSSKAPNSVYFSSISISRSKAGSLF